MTDLPRLSQIMAIQEYQRLVRAIAEAPEGEKDAAEHELTVFLKLSVEGRLPEYFASRGQA